MLSLLSILFNQKEKLNNMNLQDVANIAKTMNLNVTDKDSFVAVDNGRALVEFMLDATTTEDQADAAGSYAVDKTIRDGYRFLDLIFVDNTTTEDDIKAVLDKHLIHEATIDLDKLDVDELLGILRIKVQDPTRIAIDADKYAWHQILQLIDPLESRLNATVDVWYNSGSDRVNYSITKLNAAGPAKELMGKLVTELVQTNHLKKISEEFLKDHPGDWVINSSTGQ
jgi:hypothetical protein